MAERTTTETRAAQGVLVCRLRHKQLERGNSPLAGEVELENTSAGVADIEADMHPLRHLNLVVTAADGTVVSNGSYGDIFSPSGETRTLRLVPGAKFTHNVSLLGNVPEEKRKPGSYTIQAVYQSRGLTAVSAPLQLDLP
jgi:hypothetical protein